MTVLCAEHGIPMWRDEEDHLYRCAESQRGCEVTYTDPEELARLMREWRARG